MDGFLLAYDGFDPGNEGLREALTSTGNGYLCTRGAAEWEDADGVHYPGTYAHGGYNRETTILGGEPVLNEDLVNLPNWLVLQLRIEDEDVIRLADVDLVSYRHELDIRNVTLVRQLRFRDGGGRETTLISRRFVSMADVHHAAIEWTLVPENWSGRVEVISALDGRVSNGGVARYRQLEGRHLNPISPRTLGPEVIALKCETRQSNLYISQATRTRVFSGDQQLPVSRTLYQMEDYIQQVLAFDLHQGAATRVEKMVAFYTSRDPAVSDTLVRAATSAARHDEFAASLRRHSAAWDELWRVSDMGVSGDDEVQLLLRLHIAHVLQVCSRHTADLDAGLPARGLNGEAYRGHVFWDEIYAFPFFNFRLPEVTRGLLKYRYRRMGEARAAAREAGFRGAMFPWQSGSEGTEETQRVHLNPLSGHWEPDLSRNQRHVNAAIFYNIWNYFVATNDLEFLDRYGAEMMFEIARFWASIAHFNPERERYEISGVMGPDEFHEKYPDEPGGGLRNNAYTNVMVAWLCDIVGKLPSLLPASSMEGLRARLGIRDNELTLWQNMSRQMFVPFQGDGIISQFEGYDDLEELDWDAYRAKYGNIQRLDRILRAEGRDPNRYKITKQADTVMLFFLFSSGELREIFGRLGYDYHSDTVARNVAYYDRRTSHGSTLSFVTHAGVLASLDPESSWDRFLVALRSDVDDVQGGTTKEGIHLGVMAGTLDVMQRYYAGTHIRDEVLYFDARLPSAIGGLSFPMQFRETPVLVTLTGDRLTLAVHPEGASHPIRVGIPGDVRELCPGDQASFVLERGPALSHPARELVHVEVVPPGVDLAVADLEGAHDRQLERLAGEREDIHPLGHHDRTIGGDVDDTEIDALDAWRAGAQDRGDRGGDVLPAGDRRLRDVVVNGVLGEERGQLGRSHVVGPRGAKPPHHLDRAFHLAPPVIELRRYSLQSSHRAGEPSSPDPSDSTTGRRPDSRRRSGWHARRGGLMHEFRVWAPHPKRVEVVLGEHRTRMVSTEGGWWTYRADRAGPGSDYAFVLDGGTPRPDPRSAFQPQGVHGPSRLVDHASFAWHDSGWRGVPLPGSVLYECHVGTFSAEGTFDGAIQHLQHLANLGVDIIELLPVAEFSGRRGWGYDGVDLFAPHHAYGGPEGLKRLVDAAHAHGIGVVMDVVYNHLGPEGNYLPEFGPYFSAHHQTQWGSPAVNFDGPGSDEVRRFVTDNALMWLRDYHCDGLRLDAVHAIDDQSATHILEALTIEVRALAAHLGRPLFLIAESDLNAPRLVRSLDAGGYGLDAAWADEWHYAVHAALTGEATGTYEGFGSLPVLAKALRQAWVYDGTYSPNRQRVHGRPPTGLFGSQFVVFTQNHDRVGNRALGERSGALMSDGRLRVAAALLLTSPFVPMLFQGEEWGAITPFQYFTDHQDPGLGRAVSEGRRREVSAPGLDPDDVPDPQDRAVFERSRLDWTEPRKDRHAGLLTWYRRLIALRRQIPALTDPRLERIQTEYDQQARWLIVRRGPVTVAANLGTGPWLYPVGSPATLLEASDPKVKQSRKGIVLPPDTVAILTGTWQSGS